MSIDSDENPAAVDGDGGAGDDAGSGGSADGASGGVPEGGNDKTDGGTGSEGGASGDGGDVDEGMRPCGYCGRPVPQRSGRGRPRSYCLDRDCQARAKREREVRRSVP